MPKQKKSEEIKSEEIITFDFTQDTQKQIFATLLECDPRYESRILKLLKPVYFTNPIVQDLFKIFKDFFNEYDRVPSIKEFLEVVKQFLERNMRLKKDDYETYLDEAADIIKISKNEHLDFAYDKIIKFCQSQAYRQALLNAADKRVPTLDVEGLQEDLIKIQEIGIGFEDNAGLKLIPLSEVDAEEINWLWYNVIPIGKLTFLIGDPDVGKSFLSTFLASKISTGKPLPCVSENLGRKGTTLILSAEDSPKDTIRPRIDNTGGDPSKIIVIEGTIEKDSIKLFSFTEDLPRLKEILERRRDIKLLIVDPITAYMTKVDYFKDTDVRSKVIAPLSALADKYKIAIILIAHMTKDESKKAIYRLGGSIGLLAGARCVWCVIKDTDDMTGESRKLCCLKMNIARKPEKAMAFKIFEPEPKKPTIAFNEELVDVDIEDELTGKTRPISEAKTFLKEFLKKGSRWAEETKETAKANGIKERTLYSAKTDLGIVSDKMGKKWYWSLPNN